MITDLVRANRRAGVKRGSLLKGWSFVERMVLLWVTLCISYYYIQSMTGFRDVGLPVYQLQEEIIAYHELMPDRYDLKKESRATIGKGKQHVSDWELRKKYRKELYENMSRNYTLGTFTLADYLKHMPGNRFEYKNNLISYVNGGMKPLPKGWVAYINTTFPDFGLVFLEKGDKPIKGFHLVKSNKEIQDLYNKVAQKRNGIVSSK